MDHTTTIIESQLDWLTCSNDGSRDQREFRGLCSLLLDAERCQGNDQRHFYFRQYAGWQSGRTRYATKGPSTLLALSGDLAELHFAGVAPLATNFSRIDVAVTVRLAQYGPDLGREAYEQARPNWRPGRRYPQPALHESPPGGSTFYLGKRAADRFLRLYDKQAESKDPHYGSCWRYEVESKGTLASSLAVACAGRPDRAAFCQGYVHDAFRTRSVTPWFGPTDEPMLVRGFRRRSDADRSLAWLQRSVRPTLERLAASGLVKQMYESLGLG